MGDRFLHFSLLKQREPKRVVRAGIVGQRLSQLGDAVFVPACGNERDTQ